MTCLCPKGIKNGGGPHCIKGVTHINLKCRQPTLEWVILDDGLVGQRDLFERGISRQTCPYSDEELEQIVCRRQSEGYLLDDPANLSPSASGLAFTFFFLSGTSRLE